jgi:hypothetical protein
MTNIGERYECYSKKIYGFLTMKGFRYDKTFKHKTTGKKCWVYTMTEELSVALKEWTMGRPEKEKEER